MTELRKQNVQNMVNRAGSGARYRDGSIPCSAVEKDPEGGIICNRRGMALDSPQVWYGHQSAEQILTGSYAVLAIDVEDLNTSTDHFSFAGNELTALKRGILNIDVKVLAKSKDAGRWGFEIYIDEDAGEGYDDLEESWAGGGRGEA